MKRKIIKIDEELCNGCGDCATDCSEGAIQMIDGKARLVKEQFCDGFGDCIGACPTGALTIEEREAEEFDLDATRDFLLDTQGHEAVQRLEKAHLRHSLSENQKHHQTEAKPRHAVPHFGGGCPGSQVRDIRPTETVQPVVSGDFPTVMPSELRQWPIQIHLVPPNAPFFKNRELVIMNTCGPIASADVHWRYLRGRAVVVGCPKLDDTRPYVDKLSQILQEPTIPRVIIVRMEVPCCGGLTMIAREAFEKSERTDLIFQEDVLALDGSVKYSKIMTPAEFVMGGMR